MKSFNFHLETFALIDYLSKRGFGKKITINAMLSACYRLENLSLPKYQLAILPMSLNLFKGVLADVELLSKILGTSVDETIEVVVYHYYLKACKPNSIVL
jgi:hypothetical protein